MITGPMMCAGDHKFHPECFQCTSCRCFIGDGDSYALVERSKLYWYALTCCPSVSYRLSLCRCRYSGLCYKRQMRPLSQKSPGSVRKQHSIQLVELAPVSDGKRHIKLGVDGVKKCPMSDGYPGIRISE